MTPWPPPAMAVATGGGRAAGPATGPGTGIAGVATAPTAAISVVAVAIAERPRPVTPLAIVAAANRGPGRHDREVGQTGPSSALRWVLDPTDDHACVRALLGLHNLEGGLVACLAFPGAPWSVLARDLLLALGKTRHGIDAAGQRRRTPALLELWLRAEHVRRLVVLRAHLLPTGTLLALDQLAARTGIEVWVVAHGDTDAPPGSAPLTWHEAFTQLKSPSTPPYGDAARPEEELYAVTRDLARRAGRTWRLYVERTLSLPRHVRPGCGLGVLLQNLTIDAHHVDDLLLRLHAARSGLRDEGLDLVLPPFEHDHRLLRRLGPRFDPETVERLRRVACPLSAGALTLALATDLNAPWLAGTRAGLADPAARHVRTYPGTYRIPPQVRPMVRALLLDRAQRSDPPPALFVARDGTELLGRRLAHRVRVGAAVAGLHGGEAAIATNKCYTADTFAAVFAHASDIPRSKIKLLTRDLSPTDNQAVASH